MKCWGKDKQKITKRQGYIHAKQANNLTHTHKRNDMLRSLFPVFQAEWWWRWVMFCVSKRVPHTRTACMVELWWSCGVMTVWWCYFFFEFLTHFCSQWFWSSFFFCGPIDEHVLLFASEGLWKFGVWNCFFFLAICLWLSLIVSVFKFGELVVL